MTHIPPINLAITKSINSLGRSFTRRMKRRSAFQKDS